MAKPPSSSGNFALPVGAFTVKFKLFKLQHAADAPVVIRRHDCRSEASVIERCPDRHVSTAPPKAPEADVPTRVAGIQNTGVAAGKPATEPVDRVCPVCKNAHAKYEQVFHCANCNKDIDAAEIKPFLSYGDQLVQVDDATLAEWGTLYPPTGQMVPVAAVIANTVSTVYREDTYQVVPDKGSVRGFALWLEALRQKAHAVIVRFRLKGNAKIGMIYVAQVRSQPRLLLTTLCSLDEVTMQDFDLPDVAPGQVDQLWKVIQPLRQVPVETALVDPEVAAFRAFHEQGVEAGRAQVRLLSPVPFEDVALSQALEASVNPPAPPKARAKKSPAASASPATP